MRKNTPLLIILISVFFSCKDDDINTNTSETALDASRDETTSILTSGTWRISQATLTSGSSEIDISQNYNVVDDEFIFSGTTENGTLEWRQGYDIRTNASNSQETLFAKYVSSVTATFSYEESSSTVVEADFGDGVFELNDNNSITATIVNDDNTVFNFTLIEKTKEEYLAVVPTDLNFTSAFTFESNAINSPGMIGSYADNSFFITVREDGLNTGSGSPERVLKFDISNNNITEYVFAQVDFVSKTAHIVEDQLIVIGGQYINTYDLNLSGDPSTVGHDKTVSRFGSAQLDNDLYIIGGDLTDEESDKMFKWNLDSQTLTEFATLPEPKSGARGTIVNDNMYVFGGSETFFGDTATNTIYKVNINSPSSIEAFEMNKAIDFTFVQRFQHLIFVAGRIEVRNENNALIGRESTIGVFNTLDNNYEELNTNLTNISGFDTIYQMCIVNGKMYIIYGLGMDNGGQFNEWEVLVSDLN